MIESLEAVILDYNNRIDFYPSVPDEVFNLDTFCQYYAGTFKKEYLDHCMTIAKTHARISRDKSRKVGCVIVDDDKNILSTGYNGFPRGVNDEVEERYQKPLKYLWTEHAERNAIYNAARKGTSLKDATLVTTFFTCAECARGVIQSGISTVVAPIFDGLQVEDNGHGFDIFATGDDKWNNEFKEALQMYREVGVTVLFRRF